MANGPGPSFRASSAVSHFARCGRGYERKRLLCWRPGHQSLRWPALLSMSVVANGCSNPALISGYVGLPPQIWKQPRSAWPRQAEVTLVGARVRRARLGFPGVRATQFSTSPRVVNVVVRHRNATTEHRTVTTAGLVAPTALTATSLKFNIWADLVHDSGYRSCYVSVPSVLPGASRDFEGQVLSGDQWFEHLRARDGSVTYLQTADVGVSVRDLVAVPSTLGPGGYASQNGATYECTERSSKFGGRFLELALGSSTLPSATCGGAPLFQPVNVASDSSRRFFIGGILGALAATLVIESLFLAETDSRERRRLTRRFWTRGSKPPIPSPPP